MENIVNSLNMSKRNAITPETLNQIIYDNNLDLTNTPLENRLALARNNREFEENKEFYSSFEFCNCIQDEEKEEPEVDG